MAKKPLIFTEEHNPLSLDELRATLREIYQILQEELAQDNPVLTPSTTFDKMEPKQEEVGQ